MKRIPATAMLFVGLAAVGCQNASHTETWRRARRAVGRRHGRGDRLGERRRRQRSADRRRRGRTVGRSRRQRRRQSRTRLRRGSARRRPGGRRQADARPHRRRRHDSAGHQRSDHHQSDSHDRFDAIRSARTTSPISSRTTSATTSSSRCSRPVRDASWSARRRQRSSSSSRCWCRCIARCTSPRRPSVGFGVSYHHHHRRRLLRDLNVIEAVRPPRHTQVLSRVARSEKLRGDSVRRLQNIFDHRKSFELRLRLERRSMHMSAMRVDRPLEVVRRQRVDVHVRRRVHEVDGVRHAVADGQLDACSCRSRARCTSFSESSTIRSPSSGAQVVVLDEVLAAPSGRTASAALPRGRGTGSGRSAPTR